MVHYSTSSLVQNQVSCLKVLDVYSIYMHYYYTSLLLEYQVSWLKDLRCNVYRLSQE